MHGTMKKSCKVRFAFDSLPLALSSSFFCIFSAHDSHKTIKHASNNRKKNDDENDDADKDTIAK